MLQRLRRRLRREEGFTLIELLVVILIIGILAAIAIPSFLNQKGKGEDASAKSAARTAQTALESFATDRSSYNAGNDGAAVTALKEIEQEVADFGTDAGNITGVTTTDTTWSVTVASTDARTFTIARDANGKVTRTCAVGSRANAGGCKLDAGEVLTGTW